MVDEKNSDFPSLLTLRNLAAFQQHSLIKCIHVGIRRINLYLISHKSINPKFELVHQWRLLLQLLMLKALDNLSKPPFISYKIILETYFFD